ncbi:phage tail tape measure protein [Bacillus mycoides]|uniref:phage tail tape measure protein n=1 Tax=Bacillus mycoides TaxID=1405 RepID=UPI003CFDA3A1
MAGKIKGITIEIGGNTEPLQNALKDVNKRSNDLTQELKDVERLLKFNPGNVEALAQKQQLLTQAIENTTQKLDKLKAAEQQVQAQFQNGKISEEQYRAFRREIEFTEGSLNGLKNKLGNMKAEQDSVASSTRQLETLFSATGKSVDDFAGALGNRLVNAIKSGTATSRQLDQAIGLIGREALGAEADIEKLQRALRSVDDGNSIQQVRNDLRDLSREAERAGKSFKELDIGLENMLGGAMAVGGIQGTIEKALDTSKLKTKIDVTFEVPPSSKKSVEQAVRGIEAYGVDVEEALEGTRRQWALNKNVSDTANASIVKGAAAISTAYAGIDFTELIQESNEIGNELGITNESALALTNSLLKMGFPPEQLDIIAEYGGQLTRAGYTAEEVQAIMAAGVETGTWNIDNLLDGLKEGRIRVAEFGNEVPKALKDLLEGTKISADQMQKWGKAVAEGGKGGSQAMVEIAQALDGVDDATKKNLIGAQIFGTMYEDQGQNIINTLLGAKDKVVDLNVSQEQLNEMIKKMDASPAVKFQKAMGDLKVALEPLLGVIANIIGAFASWVSAHPALAAALTTIAVAIGILIGACMALAPVFVTLSSIAGIAGVSIGAVAGPVALVVGGFIAATAAIVGLVIGLKKLWENNEGFKNSISGVISGIQSFIDILVSLGKYLFWTAADGDHLNDWITHLPKGFQDAAEIIGLAVSKIREACLHLFDAIKAVFSGDFSQLGEIFKTIGPSIAGAIIGGLPGVLVSVSRYLPAIAEYLNANSGIILETITNIFTNIANFVTTALPQFLEVGSQMISSLVNGLVVAAPIILETIVGIINTISQMIVTYLPMIVQTGIQIIQTLISGIVQVLPTLIETGLQLILTLINGIMLMIPQLIPIAVTIIQTIINGIMSFLPQLIEMGINLLVSLITGITQALPMIALAIITVITTLIEAITANLPMIIEAGVKVLTSLIDGIIKMLPQLIDLAINLITKVADTLITNLPKIIDAGVKILLAIINGIVQVLPQLINAALDLIVKIASTLIANLPKILEAGIRILLMLIAGIVQVIPQLIGAALNLIVTLAGELIRNLPKILEAGVQLIWALIKGIVSMVGQLGSTIVTDIIPKIVDTLRKIDLFKIGKDIISGLIDGLGSMAGKVLDKVKSIGSSILDGFTGFFDIHSPSRLMRDKVGKHIGAGLAIGMENSIGIINRASQAMSEAAIPTVNVGNIGVQANGLYQAQGVNGEFPVPGGGLAIEVPVNLDGREVARGTYRYTTEYQEREAQRDSDF